MDQTDQITRQTGLVPDMQTIEVLASHNGFSATCQANGRFETKVSKPTCVSMSDATQKTARRRVDWNEQRLHRSLGQLILTKLAQRQIHTRPSEAQNFSFAVARYGGGSQQSTCLIGGVIHGATITVQ
jgi:hypothetical protein